MSEYSPEALSSGPSSATDPTLVGGQNPPSLFGVPLSYNTGAAGTPGAQPPAGGQAVDYTQPGTADPHARARTVANLSGPGDSTTVASQGYEAISGLGPDAICDTGASKGMTPLLANQVTNHPGAGS